MYGASAPGAASTPAASSPQARWGAGPPGRTRPTLAAAGGVPVPDQARTASSQAFTTGEAIRAPR